MKIARFARRQTRDAEEGACAQHLHSSREQRILRKARAARVQRAGSPSGGRHEQRERGRDVAPAAGTYKQRDSGEPDDEPSDRGPRETPAEEHAVEESDVERDDRHDQGGEAGVEAGLRPRHAAVADEQQRCADDRRGAPLSARRARAAACDERIQHTAGDQEADGRHQQRRHRPVRDPDGEVRRAPDDVDGRQGGRHRGRGAAGERCGHACVRPSGGRTAGASRSRRGRRAGRSRRSG
jgi:hypothetical protein